MNALLTNRSRYAKPMLALLLFVLLAVMGIPGRGPTTVFALDEEDPRDTGGGGYTDPIAQPYTPPSNGFTWKAENRFGVYRGDMIDFHYDPATTTYDPNYIYPSSYTVYFKACTASTEEQESTALNTYTWLIKGPGLAAEGASIAKGTCFFNFDFPHEAPYTVKLTVARKDGSGTPVSHEQNVTIRDYLIVAIGDSYGSGEGNPDVPQKYDLLGVPTAGPKWQDQRCHRSAVAGSSQAAMSVEWADPHTTVTYISFACSGATINTPSWKDMDADMAQGTGVLGRYRGVEVPDHMPYPSRDTHANDFAFYLPAQIAQVRGALTPPEGRSPRQVDALIVSGGGNDLRFGDVAVTCVVESSCWDHHIQEYPEGQYYQLRTIVDMLLRELPGKYTALADAIGSLGIPASNVYITEYPDSMRGNDRDFCETMIDDILIGKHIKGSEVSWAHNDVFVPLNTQVQTAASKHGWNFVGGIADRYRSEGGRGHGYCASDNWIRTATESVHLQGPWVSIIQGKWTKGTLHPTSRGHQVYAEQIVKTLRLDHPENTPPAFAVSSSSSAGTGGWYSSPATLTIKATDADNIATAGISVNGTGACEVSGVTCAAQVSQHEVVWTITASAEGIYQLEVMAEDARRSGATHVEELKIDLADPTPAEPVVSGTTGQHDWYTSAVDVELNGADTPFGSGVSKVVYAINGVPHEDVAPGTTVPLTADGVHTITYHVVDLAGRQSTPETVTIKIDQTAPHVQCGTGDGAWHATDVALSCSTEDALSGLADVADAGFDLATNVPSNTETATAETDIRTVCDLAGNCATAGPIGGNKVDKKVPAITLSAPANTTYLLNQTVPAQYTCEDGGSGVASCVGPVASGSNVHTAVVGTNSFTVNAADNVGNASSTSVNYTVTYNVCVLYDQAKAYKAGSVVPIKLQLCDAQKTNVSAASIVATATDVKKVDNTAASVIEDVGNANPDNNFRYDVALGGYIYNLSTKGLTAGTWQVTFAVAGDPVLHTVQFDVK